MNSKIFFIRNLTIKGCCPVWDTVGSPLAWTPCTFGWALWSMEGGGTFWNQNINVNDFVQISLPILPLPKKSIWKPYQNGLIGLMGSSRLYSWQSILSTWLNILINSLLVLISSLFILLTLYDWRWRCSLKITISITLDIEHIKK